VQGAIVALFNALDDSEDTQDRVVPASRHGTKGYSYNIRDTHIDCCRYIYIYIYMGPTYIIACDHAYLRAFAAFAELWVFTASSPRHFMVKKVQSGAAPCALDLLVGLCHLLGRILTL
jgi:hypothetical protein